MTSETYVIPIDAMFATEVASELGVSMTRLYELDPKLQPTRTYGNQRVYRPAAVQAYKLTRDAWKALQAEKVVK